MKGLPPVGYYGILLFWLALVIGTAFISNVKMASLVLATGLLIQAAVRLSHRDYLVPQIRGKLFDVSLLLILAAAMFYLGIWGGAR